MGTLSRFSAIILLPIFSLFAASDVNDIAALRDQIAAQQKQIEELKKTLETQQKLLEKLAAPEPGKPMIASTSTAAVGSALATQQPSPQAMRPAAEARRPGSPLSFRIGEADFTPGGFMDFTSIFRSTNVASGIGTSFGSIPFHNTIAGRTTENRFSAQNSRVALKVSAKPGQSTVTGYIETDLLGFLPSNAHVSSNSDSMRLRLYWLDWQRGKWEVLAGQSWSMLTPGRTGISPVPSDIFYTQDMDTNYQVGLVWTRAPQFRVVYHSGTGWHIGFALENPQQYVGGGVTLPGFAQTQVDNGTLTGAPNVHPDVQAKLAYDGKFAGGRTFHVEAAGVLRSFRVLPSATGSASTITGGAGELNGNIEVVKNFKVIMTSYYGSGGGRYLFGLGPDLIVRPSGAVSPVHSGGGIAGLEYQATPKALIFAYYGLTYFGRNYSLGPDGKYVGYGFPGSALSNNRTIQEYTIGYVHTFWKNPNYGAIQLINQYSYLTRAPWAIPAGGPFHANTNMLYNNLRYVLP